MLLIYKSRNGSRTLIDTAGFRTMELTGGGQLHCTPFITGNVLCLTQGETATIKEVTDIGDVFGQPSKRKQEAVAS